MNLKHARFIDDPRPIDETCGCPACAQGFSRSYLNHLVRQKEMLGSILISLHNIWCLLDLMRRARNAVIEGCYPAFERAFLESEAGRRDF